MQKAPPRWLDLHPGDMVLERIVTEASLRKAADSLIGYRFTFETVDNGVMVTCVESPRCLVPGPTNG